MIATKHTNACLMNFLVCFHFNKKSKYTTNVKKLHGTRSAHECHHLKLDFSFDQRDITVHSQQQAQHNQTLTINKVDLPQTKEQTSLCNSAKIKLKEVRAKMTTEMKDKRIIITMKNRNKEAKHRTNVQKN